MKKPEGYNEAAAYSGTGGSRQLPTGGYICRIKNAKEETNSGYWQLALAFDIAEGPEEGFYNDAFKARQQYGSDAKWPAVYRQMVEGKDGKANPFFKGMITAIEESNPGFAFNFDEKTLIGKLFGGVFGQEEFTDQNGVLRTTTKLQQIRSVNAIRQGDFKVPDIKREKASAAATTAAPVNIGECPF